MTSASHTNVVEVGSVNVLAYLSHIEGTRTLCVLDHQVLPGLARYKRFLRRAFRLSVSFQLICPTPIP
jgi:hypothetical protein